MTDLLYLFRTKSQQASHEANEMRKKNERQQKRERPIDQRDTRRDDKRDFLGISVLGYHKTLINNPFSGKKKR
ncbi:MAG: hypothetical protein MPEBLZ_02059 [Candidatus Methanoperedens nitroreducens]|uniref:Uncharacterized protein n=1 Tax=Candidatus Methanoperedens nitratireducens TaxID=1392998 RepID=A0A0P8A9U1_9EURY|nr:MAG: hypothetical protein MPEBLZ_02059 [Candidatus Methanoperedens sp. BLZ1]